MAHLHLNAELLRAVGRGRRIAMVVFESREHQQQEDSTTMGQTHLWKVSNRLESGSLVQYLRRL